MAVEVGDKVRVITHDYDGIKGYEFGDVVVVDILGESIMRSGPWSFLHGEYEPIDTTIATQIRDRMEEHMGKGEYVRAVKWAQLAELAETLENE